MRRQSSQASSSRSGMSVLHLPKGAFVLVSWVTVGASLSLPKSEVARSSQTPGSLDSETELRACRRCKFLERAWEAICLP